MEECPICLSPLSGTVTTVGCCKKQFHTGCILKCAQTKNECPMCRVRDCIVYVPEPEPEQVLIEYDRSRIVKSVLGTVAGCFLLAITIRYYS